MTEKEKIALALRNLAKAIEPLTSPDTAMVTQHGWHHPPFSGRFFSTRLNTLAGRVSEIPADVPPNNLDLAGIVPAIEVFQTQTLPYVFNGNAPQALPAFLSLIDHIESVFNPYFGSRIDWERMADTDLVPRAIATRLRGIRVKADRFDTEVGELAEKIRTIELAHSAANQLPTDLDELRSAKEEILSRKQAAEADAAIAATAKQKADDALASIEALQVEAAKLVQNVEDAYSAATTKGLGQSFQARADRLAKSMWAWVGGLVVALLIGAGVGVYRIWKIEDLLRSNPNDQSITLNMVLAFLSVAGPIWFAWLATKQIGHRFRLSEDYAFKASVAQAYEGYRREAARLDPAFAQRLFGSALDRIDEPPIRFVEQETYGSPWHELWRNRIAKARSNKENSGSVESDLERIDGEKRESAPRVRAGRQPTN